MPTINQWKTYLKQKFRSPDMVLGFDYEDTSYTLWRTEKGNKLALKIVRGKDEKIYRKTLYGISYVLAAKQIPLNRSSIYWGANPRMRMYLEGIDTRLSHNPNWPPKGFNG
jgi:hypothetical protein